ncbi:uncharacterized protein LOC102807742 [Saccoglossus kowalevskii]|uniref:Uncharacterized protein LOC102807742 n=1 Tax=Saccoglossus kowalevskii TaxID=10224 RepID=A0ABM0MP38_SACKO|nr:PREDICTED: uncharacterized protein LOC102807742 [Saccoglossus kowalevskii]
MATAQLLLSPKRCTAGDPLSPALFILVLETLLISIRGNRNTAGITIAGKEVKESAFADDMTCFLSNSESVDNLMQVLKKFHECRGLKINRDKTEAVWLGKWKNKNEEKFGVKWPTSPIKIVGVHFSYDKEEMQKINIEKPLNNLRKVLNQWKSRKLSIFGKTQIIKTFGLSQFTYILANTYVKNSVLKEVHKIVYNFIWEGVDRIARKTMIDGVGKGGIGMVDLYVTKKIQRILWLKHTISKETDHPWKYFVKEKLNKLGGDMLLKCNYSTRLLPVKFSAFMTDCFDTWAENKGMQDNMDQVLWNNKLILIGGKSIFYQNMYDSGIRFISDLYIDGILKPWNEYKEKGLSLIDKLKWIGICNTVPEELKHCKVLENRETTIVIKNKQILLEDLTKNMLKTEFISKIFVKPISECSLERKLNLEIEWKKMYKMITRLSIDTKSREFHFKLLHNILYTNDHLHKVNPERFPEYQCTFCNEYSETYEHLFMTCKFTESLWHDVIKELGRPLKITEVPGKLCVILGDPEYDWPVNFVCSLIRNHIYYSKWKKQKPNYANFINLLKHHFQIESAIAKQKEKETSHKKKWSSLIPYLK